MFLRSLRIQNNLNRLKDFLIANPGGLLGYILDRDAPARLVFWVQSLGRAYFFGSIICTVIFWVPEFLHYFFGSQVWVNLRNLGTTYLTNKI